MNRYIKDKCIYEAHFSKVFTAKDTKTDTEVIWKQPVSACANIELALHKTLNLSDVPVVKILDSWDDNDDQANIIMEKCDMDLFDYYEKKNAPMDVRQVLIIAHEITKVLVKMMQLGLIHADVSLENILIKDGHPLLTDFGLAKPISCQFFPRTGKMLYMPPEWIHEELQDENYDGSKADVFSLGVLMMILLINGDPGVHGKDFRLYGASKCIPHFLYKTQRNITKEQRAMLEVVLIGMLSRDPRQRSSLFSVQNAISSLLKNEFS